MDDLDPGLQAQGEAVGKSLFVLQLIVAAMTDGVIVFGAVVGWLHWSDHFGAAQATEGDVKLLGLLSWLHAVAAVPAVMVAWRVSKGALDRKLRPLAEAIAAGDLQQDSPDAMIKFIQISYGSTIARMAILEGVAVSGLTICLLAVANGVMDQHPEYWLNLISPGLLLLYVAMSFPTRHRVAAALNQQLAYTRGAI